VGSRHRRCKPVAARGDRLNAAPLRSPLVEYPAECGDLDRQVRILDDGAPPNGRHDLLFRYEIPGPLDKHTENIERSEADRYRNEDAAFVTPRQAIALPIEAKFLEQENVGRGEHDPVSRLPAPFGRGARLAEWVQDPILPRFKG